MLLLYLLLLSGFCSALFFLLNPIIIEPCYPTIIGSFVAVSFSHFVDSSVLKFNQILNEMHSKQFFLNSISLFFGVRAQNHIYSFLGIVQKKKTKLFNLKNIKWENVIVPVIQFPLVCITNFKCKKPLNNLWTRGFTFSPTSCITFVINFAFLCGINELIGKSYDKNSSKAIFAFSELHFSILLII